MRRTERSIPLMVGVLAAAIVGGLAGCEQQTANAPPAPAAAPAAATAAATDSRSFMKDVVQPATQVLWNYGYAEKMSDENWAEVEKAATTLIDAMPTIAAGGFSVEEKARATQGGWQGFK